MAQRFPGTVSASPSPRPPEPSVPDGWSVIPLGPDPVRLTWPALPDTELALRITVACDTRDHHLIDVRLPNHAGGAPNLPDGRIGLIDIRYAYAYQVFELVLPARLHREVAERGLVLRQVQGDVPVWIFDDMGGAAGRTAFVPHLAETGGEPSAGTFVDSMLSLDSLQPFGWLEGCVLEGMHALRHSVGAERTDAAIRSHLDHFLTADGDLVYETLHGRRLVNDFETIEALLPFGQLARLEPDHPTLAHAMAYLTEHEPVVDTARQATAEGCYTVGYPLARVATMTGRSDLVNQALDQLLFRRDQLVLPGRGMRLRNRPCAFGDYFVNWGRGWTWFLLGHARVIELARDCPGVDAEKLATVEAEFVARANEAAGHQLPDGRWACFIDEPGTGPENSASAGIATALVVGTRLGLGDWREAGERAQASLLAATTADGLLPGVSQHNAGGETLQRSGYRVFSQMGMGLLAQLVGELAALEAART